MTVDDSVEWQVSPMASVARGPAGSLAGASNAHGRFLALQPATATWPRRALAGRLVLRWAEPGRPSPDVYFKNLLPLEVLSLLIMVLKHSSTGTAVYTQAQ